MWPQWPRTKIYKTWRQNKSFMFTQIVSGSLLAECKRTNILQKRISMYKLIIFASALVKTILFYFYINFLCVSVLWYHVFRFSSGIWRHWCTVSSEIKKLTMKSYSKCHGSSNQSNDNTLPTKYISLKKKIFARLGECVKVYVLSYTTSVSIN